MPHSDSKDRRESHRYLVSGRLTGKAHATLDVRLLDLSSTGARIEHNHLLRPGMLCAFEFPPAIGKLVLSARIVHSAVVGADQGSQGERLLRYQSGLTFLEVKPDQQAALEAILERIAPSGGLGNGRLIV